MSNIVMTEIFFIVEFHKVCDLSRSVFLITKCFITVYCFFFYVLLLFNTRDIKVYQII